MTPKEGLRLNLLDAIVRSKESKIQPIINRVRLELAHNNQRLMAWEPIPLDTFGPELPEGIQSGWVFILRAGADTGPERHPNSHQRMMTLEGRGNMQTDEPPQRSKNAQRSTPHPEIKQEASRPTGNWKSNLLIGNPDAPLEQRWISIPPNTWHRPVVGKDSHWVVVSFHTVPAEELIEEKPDFAHGTRQMKYVGDRG